MQLCLFTHEFHFIEIGKKIRACGHDFEEAMHAYDNLRNPREDVTDLIGQMEALIVVKYSPRWYNIFWQNTPGPYPRDLHVICCLNVQRFSPQDKQARSLDVLLALEVSHTIIIQIRYK